MKKIYLSLLLLTLLTVSGFALEPGYPVGAISEDMKKNADAVVRYHKKEFLVQSRALGIEREHYVVTIFNKNARDEAIKSVPYDQFIKVKRLEGKVYNAHGKEIAKLKKKDIEDISTFDGSSFVSDARVKIASLEQNEYPYTVEWIYEVETQNMMFYPIWYAQSREKEAVEEAELVVEMPAGMKLRYWENSLAPACKVSAEPLKTVYHWKVRNLPAFQLEPLSVSATELIPIVYTAPYDFEVAGYAGSMDSWESYGKWINLLNNSQNDLPAAAVEKVKELTQNLPTDREKIKAVYDYLQGKTRYVGIQLGIGGWQPFKTSFVHEKGYGDCKALSFYTKSLLEAIGIPSYYTLIYADESKRDVREDFPMSTFNHAILCVPNQQDTVWLECTSQTNPFGFLGSKTCNREAVIITEEGGKIVKTPQYRDEQNLQNTTADVKIEGGTNAHVVLERSYAGLQFENQGLSHYLHLGAEEQRKWIYKAVKIPSYEIQDFSFSLKENEVPEATLKSTLKIRNFINSTGKRSFITLNLVNQSEARLASVNNRRSDFETGFPWIDTDTIVYHLPEGVKIEYLMEDVDLKSEFGEYRASARQEDGKIIYRRYLKQAEGRFPAEKYNEFVQFWQEVGKADKGRAVILNP